MFKRINWITGGFLVVTPLAAAVWAGVRTYHDGISLGEILFSAAYLVITGMSITAGYHRLFSHRAYEARSPVRAFYLLFGAAAYQDSALAWSRDHRRHHQNIDREGDPYSAKDGFLWAHIGWLMVNDHLKSRSANTPDLEKDWMVIAQDRYYGSLSFLTCFGIPFAVGMAVGNPWGFLLWGGLVRVVVGQHITFLVNSLAHTVGRQSYEPAISARDSIVTALLTFGEGYHNFHHRFASDYRNGVGRYAWDPTKWLIRGLAYCGLATNLRRIPRERIIAARMRADRLRLLERARECSHEAVSGLQEQVSEIASGVERAVERLGHLEREFALARTNAANVSREKLAALRADLRLARREFRAAWRGWTREVARLFESGALAAPG